MPRKPDDPTEREWQVWQLLGQGKNREEIAEALHISVKTVDFHLQNLRAKTSLSTVELAVRAARDQTHDKS